MGTADSAGSIGDGGEVCGAGLGGWVRVSGLADRGSIGGTERICSLVKAAAAWLRLRRLERKVRTLEASCWRRLVGDGMAPLASSMDWMLVLVLVLVPVPALERPLGLTRGSAASSAKGCKGCRGGVRDRDTSSSAEELGSRWLRRALMCTAHAWCGDGGWVGRKQGAVCRMIRAGGVSGPT